MSIARKLTRMLPVFIVGAGVVVGCDNSSKDEPAGDDTESTTTAKDSAKESSEPQRPANPNAGIIRAMNPVINHCLNTFGTAVANSMRDYMYMTKGASVFPAKLLRGPTVNKMFGDIAKCQAAANQVATAAPKETSLAAAARAFAASLVALEPRISEAQQYYSQKDFKDDKYAKGRAMHGPLMKAFQGYLASRMALTRELDTIQLRLEQTRLAELKKDPARKLEYLLLDGIVTAKQLLHTARAFEIKQSKLAGGDPDQAMRLAKTLHTNALSLRDQVKKTPPRRAKQMFYRRYLESVDALALAGKELARRSREGKPFNSAELGAMKLGTVVGSPQRIVRQYNDAVRSYNHL